MAEKKCSNLIEQGHCNQYDHFICDVTKDVCVASTFENSDPGHPASCEFAEFHHYLAELCPAYNVCSFLLKKIKKHWKKISDTR